MTWRRQVARRLIGASLLLPSLLLIHSPGTHAEGKPGKPAPKRTASKAQAAGKATRPVGAPPTAGTERCTHTVRRGDSVARLATQYRVPRQGIVSGNRLATPHTLTVGQRLSIPGCRAGKAPPHGPEPPAAVELDNGLLLARVGPRHIPTRLFLAVPEFDRETVDFSWPVDGPILSGFGKRRSSWHAGIDIKADRGTPVLAAAAGTVVFSGWAASYGRTVKIRHAHGFISIYAHTNENMVKTGDEVAAGAVIAIVGQTGRASTPHLHFEIRRDGMAYNPVYLLDTQDGSPVLVSAMAEPQDEDDEPRE